MSYGIRTIIVVAVVGLAFFLITGYAGAEAKADPAGTVHVLVTVEDQDTELELCVDGNWKGQHILDQGRTVYAYKTTAKKPTVKMLAYGDEIRPELTQGRNGDWYGVVDLKRPRDGDGGVE